MNVLVLLFVMMTKSISQIYIQIFNEIAILISLTGIPYLLYTKILGYKIKKIKKTQIIVTIILKIVIFLGLIVFFDKSVVVHYLIIAFAEEMHFRTFQYEFLEKQLGAKKAVIISSVIFAFILHLNDPIWGNLVIRLPLGMILCLIQYKFGVTQKMLRKSIYEALFSFIIYNFYIAIL